MSISENRHVMKCEVCGIVAIAPAGWKARSQTQTGITLIFSVCVARNVLKRSKRMQKDSIEEESERAHTTR